MSVGLFISDFEFGTKVAEKLSELEVKFEFYYKPEDINSETQLLIVDLNDVSIGHVNFVSQLANENKDVQIIGFLENVIKDKHEEFKKAGCRLILPKSSLIKNLATFVKR